MRKKHSDHKTQINFSTPVSRKPFCLTTYRKCRPHMKTITGWQYRYPTCSYRNQNTAITTQRISFLAFAFAERRTNNRTWAESPGDKHNTYFTQINHGTLKSIKRQKSCTIHIKEKLSQKDNQNLAKKKRTTKRPAGIAIGFISDMYRLCKHPI